MTLAEMPTIARPQTPPPIAPSAWVPAYEATTVPLRRFSVEEYQRLIREGFFAADERCELLEGLVVQKMSRDPVHDAVIEIVNAVLVALMPPGWRVRPQSGATTNDSQPEPDLVVVRGTPREYLARHPGPADLALVVEVSNSTLADDRKWKGRIYARAGIGVYWIVNLPDRRLEIYTDPTGPDAAPAYRRREDFLIGQAIPFVIEGVERGPIAVADLLP